MLSAPSNGSRTDITALEAAVASARGGFACMFSTSDEFETAIITERRAQGRYDRPNSHLPFMLFIGCALTMVGAVLLLR